MKIEYSRRLDSFVHSFTKKSRAKVIKESTHSQQYISLPEKYKNLFFATFSFKATFQQSRAQSVMKK
jgi:hypothetical protein